MTEIEVEIEIGVEQQKDIWHQEDMTEDIKAQTPIQGPGIDLLLGSQWTETELDATNVEYDHFVNECPNSVTDDSDNYESDGAALQLITIDAEIHLNSEGTRPIEEQDYLNL